MANQPSAALQALQTAIEVEKNGLITYLKFARQTKDEFGKNMFIQLAIDEFEHQQILEKQLQKLLENGKWEMIDIPHAEIERVAPLIHEKTRRTKGESGLQDVDALNTALALERKAADFFREKSKQATESEARALFQRLAEWEDTHYDIIQAELDAINQSGFWFGIPEFQMDGKF